MPTSAVHTETLAPTARTLPDGRRVLLVTEAASAGVGRHVIDLAEQLILHGLDVHLVYATGRIDAAFQRGLEMDGLTTHVLEMRRNPHPSDLAALRGLVRILRVHGPFDLIHGHSSKGGALARMAASRLGIPAVYTPHCMITMNPDLSGLASALFRRVECWLARRTAALIAVSPDERDHMHELGFAAERVHAVANGVPEPAAPNQRQAARIEARRRLGLSDSIRVIGFVGRLSPQKDPVRAIETFARIAPTQGAVRLVMVGDGPLRELAERRAHELGVASRVLWTGHANGAQLMPAFDLLLLPSAYEGMPYVLLEALACGLPIVATDVGGVQDIVIDGDNGFVARDGTPATLAKHVGRILDQDDLGDQLSEGSLRRAAEFSVSAMARRTLRIYDQVAPRPATTAGSAR